MYASKIVKITFVAASVVAAATGVVVTVTGITISSDALCDTCCFSNTFPDCSCCDSVSSASHTSFPAATVTDDVALYHRHCAAKQIQQEVYWLRCERMSMTSRMS
jgi:hypothetical protein